MKNQNDELFHQRLERLRIERGFNVKEFAGSIGVPESTYREWEYGRIRVPPFVKMSEVLQVPLSLLITGHCTDLVYVLNHLQRIQEEITALKIYLAPRI